MGFLDRRLDKKLVEWATRNGFRYDLASQRPKTGMNQPKPGPAPDVFDQDRFLTSALPTARLIDKTAVQGTFLASNPPRVENVVTGGWRNLPMSALHVSWQVDEGSFDTPTSGRVDKVVVGAVTEVGLTLPTLTLSRETRVSRLLKAIDLSDVELGVPEIDRTWQIRTGDPDFARTLLDERMLEFLRGEELKKLWFETGGPFVFVGREGLLASGDLELYLNAAAEFVTRIPEPIWRARGLPASRP